MPGVSEHAVLHCPLPQRCPAIVGCELEGQRCAFGPLLLVCVRCSPSHTPASSDDVAQAASPGWAGLVDELAVWSHPHPRPPSADLVDPTCLLERAEGAFAPADRSETPGEVPQR